MLTTLLSSRAVMMRGPTICYGAWFRAVPAGRQKSWRSQHRLHGDHQGRALENSVLIMARTANVLFFHIDNLGFGELVATAASTICRAPSRVK
jgi:hypothetical protein